jgi:DNA-directed RNA polymerase specialized sigma24 family protein
MGGNEPERADFPDTRWSMVSAIRHRAEDGPRAEEALASICQRYWYPLYAFARRQSLDTEDAQDATQGFFAKLIEKESLGAADPERGRLRTFLLAAFKHFLADARDHRNRWRRGGRTETVSFDAVGAEERYSAEPRDDSTPDRLFHRRWALTILQRALDTLETERAAAGRAAEMEVLRPFLDASGGSGESSYIGAAQALGWPVNSTRVAVHRLRQRYRRVLQDQVAATLENEDPALIEDEMRALLAALA